jgi:hypothetical protein
MSFHPRVLGSLQQRVLGRLAPLLTPRGFYLGGGTGLAVQLGHRRSVDLDWFTATLLADPLRLAEDLRAQGVPFVTRTIDQGTLHGNVSGVRVSLLEYRYPLLQPVVGWPRFACELASLSDLAAMKLAAQASRGAKKDLVDIHTLARRFAPLPQMLEGYRQKYSVEDVAHVVYSLVYFEDADRQPMPRMLWRVDWRSIKQALRVWVHELMA